MSSRHSSRAARSPVRFATLAIVIAWCVTARADDGANDQPGPAVPPVRGDAKAVAPLPDPDTIPAASSQAALATAPGQEVDTSARDHRAATGLALAGVYTGFAMWAYFAWYRNHPETLRREVGGDGWFGVHTYAGGADKMGHAWFTMVAGRGGTALLRAGGWEPTRSAITSAILAEALMFAVEVKDYYYYEFSISDMTGNTAGAALGLALDLWPRLDELFDYRVQYWPSKQYRYNLLNSDSPCVKRQPGQPSCSRWNIAEDYSGETYLLAFHLGGIHALRDSHYGGWTRFVDVVAGFESRHYKPPPTLDPDIERRQRLFFGVSLNAQGLTDYLFGRHRRVRKVAHGAFEVFSLPFTTLPIVNTTRSTTAVDTGGA